ncbi:ABC transporter substrate-binding protein [Sphaerisporangium sp. NBC_01403]|uniref:ABC transporter substrate-binding protein n=1 Tax=Sphaerisporangium sp. NBC_01403 TaxID=2903599 RepID=UPI003251165E
MPRSRLSRPRAAAVALAIAAVVTGCSSTPPESGPVRLRLGYFPNLTHATAILGVQDGTFQRALGSGAKLEPALFTSGPPAITAILSDAVDAVFVGATPAVNAFYKTKGNVKVISGATSGGAQLVVGDGITSAADLKGRTVADPALGGAPDIQLRYWLKRHGLRTGTAGDGDVHIAPQDNAQMAAAYASGAIDGAWVPQPYATLLVNRGAHVLVNEHSLWPDGRFNTTNLLVRADFLKRHPDVVVALLRGLVKETDQVNADPARAAQRADAAIDKINGGGLDDADLRAAWSDMTFTVDPLLPTIKEYGRRGTDVGVLPGGDLTGLADLGPLNEALRAEGKAPIAG